MALHFRDQSVANAFTDLLSIESDLQLFRCVLKMPLSPDIVVNTRLMFKFCGKQHEEHQGRYLCCRISSVDIRGPPSITSFEATGADALSGHDIFNNVAGWVFPS